MGMDSPFAAKTGCLNLINCPFVLLFTSIELICTIVRFDPVSNKNFTDSPFILHMPVIW